MAPPQVICSTKRPSTRRPSRPTSAAAATTRRSSARTCTASTCSAATRRRPVTRRSSSGLGQVRDIGIKSDQDFDRPAPRPQSDYTPVVQAMKSNGSNYGQCTRPYPCTVLTPQGGRRSRASPASRSGTAACSATTRSSSPPAAATSRVEYVDTLFLPFLSKADQKANTMLGQLREVHRCGQGRTASAPTPGRPAIAFRDAVNASVKARRRQRPHPQDDLRGAEQRSTSSTPTACSARSTSPAARPRRATCSLQVKNGTFVRVFPTKPGTFDCAKKNVVQVKLERVRDPTGGPGAAPGRACPAFVRWRTAAFQVP